MARFCALFVQTIREALWLDGARIRRIGGVFALFALICVAWDIWLHTRAGITDMDGEQLGRDFVNYWGGAHLAAQGHAAQVYDIKSFVAWQRAHTAANAHFKWYSYPPTMLVLSLPLAMLDFVPALAVWLLAGGLACTALLARFLDWRMALLAAFATPASLVNALWGQNGQFSAAFMVGGIMFLDRRPWLAGILLGSLCYKPHLAILVPFALAAGGYWRSFVAAGLTALALCACVFLLGPGVWHDFLRNAPINAGLLEAGDSMWHRMPTVFAAMRLMGGSVAVAYGAQALSAVIAVLLTIRIWRGAVSLAVKGTALTAATFLSTPYAWDYDTIALVVSLAWFAADIRRAGFYPWEKIAIAAAIAMPVIFSPLAQASHVQIGPLILCAILALMTRRALRYDHQGRETSVRQGRSHEASAEQNRRLCRLPGL
jgi:hypothetical protein